MTDRITILLAITHPIVRSNLRSLLERESDLIVVAEASNGREAVLLADYKRPDVVVLDIALPILTGIESARAIRSSFTGAAILFYSDQTDLGYISAAFDAGARGYLAADTAPSELARATRVVGSGLRYISPCISRSLFKRRDGNTHSGPALSDTDQTICCVLAAGCGVQEVRRYFADDADRLVFSNDDYLNRPVQWGSLPDVIALSASENQQRLKDLMRLPRAL